MYRFTTPTHRFKFKTNPDDFAKIEITYVQRGNIILIKTKEDITIEANNIVSLYLTQEETAMFLPNVTASVQIRVMTNDNSVFASKVVNVEILPILNNVVLEGE